MRSPAASVLLAALVLTAGPACGSRSFEDYPAFVGLERTTLKNADGDRLDVIGYTSRERRPAIVVIPGSLCAPLFAALDKDPPGEWFSTIPMLSEQNRASMDAHLVYLERRNVVSLETMASAPEFSVDQIFKLSPCTERNGGITLEHRLSDVQVQLAWLAKQRWVASIHLVGVSEGADVAAGVAAVEDSPVDSLMLVGGAGPSQFFDFAQLARRRNDLKGVEAAFSELGQFLSSSPPASYQGYDGERWLSFAIRHTPLDELSKSAVPLFIAHGDQDENVPIASADLAAIELMRRQPSRAIYYWSVVGGAHMLDTPNGSRLEAAILRYVAWATSQPTGRTFKVE
jgi:hypothetical protein